LNPKGFPHIVDASDFDDETDTNEMTFADGIAINLPLELGPYPFAKFFDLSQDRFELHYVAPDDLIKDMIIAQTGRSVIVREVNWWFAGS
jgi:hypothetical protein